MRNNEKRNTFSQKGLNFESKVVTDESEKKMYAYQNVLKDRTREENSRFWRMNLEDFSL